MISSMSLNEKLRRLKGARTYAELARAVGCTAANVRRIIDGDAEPKLTLGVRLARTLGADLDWLVDDEAEGDPPPDDRQKVSEMVAKALTVGGLVGDLSPKEIELIGMIRGLDSFDVAKLDGYLMGLVSQEPMTPEKAARMLQDAADRVTAARRTDPKR